MGQRMLRVLNDDESIGHAEGLFDSALAEEIGALVLMHDDEGFNYVFKGMDAH